MNFSVCRQFKNQSEMDSLRKKLNLCLEEKEKLERRVSDLLKELEDERSSRGTKEGNRQTEVPTLSANVPVINSDDQMELKTMVDAIALASEREAEAHERAIILSKENDELRTKIMVLLEDNNKLIELYEQAAAESSRNHTIEEAKITELRTEVQNNGQCGILAEEKQNEMKIAVQNLEHQLMEMNEENEKLMGLYEQAMHERDEFKKILSSHGGSRVETKGGFDCPEKLVEVDGGGSQEISVHGLNMQVGTENHKSDEPRSCIEATIQAEKSEELMETSIEETGFSEMNGHDGSSLCHDDHQAVAGSDIDVGAISDMETEPSNVSVVKVSEDLNLVKEKLNKAQEKLIDSARTVTLFGLLEKTIVQVDKLSKEIEAMEDGIQVKQQQFESLKHLSSEMQERTSLVDKKLLALKYSLSNFSSSVVYFEQREARARARVSASMTHLNQKKEELARLQACKDEIEASQRKVQQSDVELRTNLASLKSKLEEENKRHENEKVLFAIDNVEKVDPSQRNCYLGGKATELLKSEEEKTKLQTEMKLVREKLVVTKRESEDLNRKLGKLEGEMQAVQIELQKGTTAVEEMDLALQAVLKEKEMLLEIRENGKTEIETMILEYHQQAFEFGLKEAEMKMLEEELQQESGRMEELRKVRAEAAEKMTQILEDGKCSSSCFLSEKMEEELQNVHASVLEAKLLLGEDNSIDS